jgi:hypothetical protein
MKVVEWDRSERVVRAAQPNTIAAFIPVCSGIFAGHFSALLPVGGGFGPPPVTFSVSALVRVAFATLNPE